MKKEKRIHRKGSQLERFGTISPVLWFFVICFTLMPLQLLTSLVGIASAGSAVETEAELVQRVSAVPIDPNSPQQRQLWRAEIGVAESRPDQESRLALKQLIEQVRSVTFEPKKRQVEPVIVPVEVGPAEPDKSQPDAKKGEDEEQERELLTSKPKLPYEPVSEETLKVLRDLSKNPEKVSNPFELGETLFLSGNMTDAVVFYTEALDRTEPNDVDPAGNRAWMLFQAGNCLRNTNMSEAVKMYRLLLTEYPNSQWETMAKAQLQLIDWYMKNEPHKLIADKEQTGGK